MELLRIDVANSNSLRQAREQLEQHIEALDVLINNAVIAGEMPQDFVSGSSRNLRLTFETNFFGTVQTTQEFLPLLKKSEAAHIINVSSKVGSITLRTVSGRNMNRDQYNAYGASKTALNAFKVMLANELNDALANRTFRNLTRAFPFAVHRCCTDGKRIVGVRPAMILGKEVKTIKLLGLSNSYCCSDIQKQHTLIVRLN